MDDKTGALEKLKAIMAKAEQVDMSSVKIGDIIYVPLDEEDGLIPVSYTHLTLPTKA